MADQRALDAIARIERALGRIEAASSQSRSGSAESSAELARVRHAHQKLRERVEGAIGQLDGLLETEGQS